MWVSRTWLLKHADASLGAVLCRALGFCDYLTRRGVPMTDPDIGPVKRLLVIRPGGIGDLILLLPVLRTLRSQYPDAAMDVICEKRNIEVLSLAGLEVDAITYDRRPLRLLTRLKSRRYDLVIDAEQFHNFSAIFSLLSGAGRRIGFKINPLRNPLYTHLVNYSPDGYEGEQFAALLKPLGIETGGGETVNAIREHAPPLQTAAAEAWRTALGDAPVVALHVGSSTPYKLWAVSRFVEVGRRLHDRLGLGVAVLGGRQERETAEHVVAELKTAGVPAASLAGELTLSETATAICKAELFVGPDSGISHMAAAVDTRTVTLFGPSDPDKWGRENERHRAIRVKLPCSPCFIFGFSKPCRTFECMKAIQVDDVFAACESVMRNQTGGVPDDQ